MHVDVLTYIDNTLFPSSVAYYTIKRSNIENVND